MTLTRRSIAIRDLTLILMMSVFVIPPVSAESLPEWVSRPPADTTDAWYGVGEGGNVENARAQALADLAGRLATKVLSDVKIDQYSISSERGSTYEERISSMVSTQVEDTKLSHYRLKETQDFEGRIWALVELSISKMIASNEAELRDRDTRVSQFVNRRAKRSRLERMLGEPELSRVLTEAESSILMLRSLRPGFDGGYMPRYLEIRNGAAKDRIAIRTVIETDEVSKVFSQQLSSQLNQRGFHARVGRSTPGDVVIRVAGSVENREAFGVKQTTLTLMLTTLDDEGAQLASVERRGRASASSGYPKALELAAKTMAKDAKKNNPLEYLGLLRSVGAR
jgi:hypothetical protein